MCGENEEIVATLEKILGSLEDKEPEIIMAVRVIAFSNLSTGRIHKFLYNKTVNNCVEYVERLVSYYKEWHIYVERLQVEQDHQLWTELLEKFEKWARRFLIKMNFPPGWERNQAAQDCAAEAGTILINKEFPYDANFDSWASTILYYVCLRHVGKLWNKNVPQQNEIAADVDALLRQVPDRISVEGFREFELGHDLFQAIELLSSDARKQFVYYYYVEMKSFDEIAILMNKNKNSLYKLHRDSLDNLRKNLGGIQDKDE